MKKLLYILVLGVVLFGCSKSDKTEEENSITGNWKAEALIGSDGANRYVTPIENGQTIIFKNDDTFEVLDSSIECASGTYAITEDSSQNFNMDIISLVCDNGNLIQYAFTFEEGKLLLSFIVADGSTGCDEICAERYVKLPE
ncbi:hypothetical protein POV26_01250 [Aequorivita todarodis]|uniref:hypothetical protein n=1 Tax=Aequorivita todarodis TaxID=2036821 RepID=UPI00235105A5|nr:hypothetical protein [Aequorivita todarodis]MDC7999655.1 hypothetical protein [Aequorivita todarodis]